MNLKRNDAIRISNRATICAYFPIVNYFATPTPGRLVALGRAGWGTMNHYFDVVYGGNGKQIDDTQHTSPLVSSVIWHGILVGVCEFTLNLEPRRSPINRSSLSPSDDDDACFRMTPESETRRQYYEALTLLACLCTSHNNLLRNTGKPQCQRKTKSGEKQSFKLCVDETASKFQSCTLQRCTSDFWVISLHVISAGHK